MRAAFCFDGTLLTRKYHPQEERVNLAADAPEMVEFLKRRISAHNSSHVWQANQFNPPLDPRSSPKNLGNVWSPWLPNAHVAAESDDGLVAQLEA